MSLQKFTAKLRDYKTDNNLLLLKTEMNAGHGGKTGRDSAIEEVALTMHLHLKLQKNSNLLQDQCIYIPNKYQHLDHFLFLVHLDHSTSFSIVCRS